MSGDYLDRDPGMYDGGGAAMALVEQQRMNIIKHLRTTRAASVTIYDETGDGLHWGIYLDDGEAEVFLSYAAARAILDLAAALGESHEHACALVLEVISAGIIGPIVNRDPGDETTAEYEGPTPRGQDEIGL